MQHIAALEAGIASAANGTAELYVRGTSTRATWYPDFEGSTANSSGADITLDSYGSATVYVNSYVTVVVKNESGATVRSFVAGTAAPTVEYQGQSFTGTNYESALTGAGSGYPVSLQTILNLWKTNSGAIDWKVDIDGAATTLSVMAGMLTGLVYNVRSSEFGAVGDNTTDDTAAIQAAIDAAAAPSILKRGGYVYFPPGRYRVTAPIAVGADVSLVGAGYKSIIDMDHATNGIFTYSGSGVGELLMHGLQLTTVNSSGACVAVASGTKLTISHCIMGSDTGSCISAAASTTTRLTVRDSELECGVTTAASITAPVITSATSAQLFIERCVFTTPPTYNPTDGALYGNSMRVRDCRFVGTATTSGTVPYVAFNSTTVVGSVEACTFLNGGGGTMTAMALGTYVAASTFSESHNIFGSTVTAYSYVFAAANTGAKVFLHSRAERIYTISSNASPLAMPTDQYGICVITKTGTAALTITATAPPEGSRGTIVVANGGFAFTLTPGTGFQTHDVTRAVSSLGGGEQPAFDYVSAVINSNVRCMMVEKYLY